MTDGHRRLARLALTLSVCAGCNHQSEPDCVMQPCPLPLAIMVRVASATGGPVPGLTLTLSGAAAGSGQCSADASTSVCVVPGMPGTYNLRFAAPGFQEKKLSITVQGSTPPCGCTSVQRQDLDVVLSPN